VKTIRLLLSVLAVCAGLSLATTTVSVTPPFGYDVARISSVDVSAGDAVYLGSPPLPDTRAESAPRSVESRGASTTLLLRTVATKTAASSGGAIEGMWAQAPYDGFLGNFRATATLKPGTVIDRYGAETGRFFSPAGTPLEARALPAGSGSLNSYEVLKPFEVQGGIAAPAFGQPGLGIQYMPPQTAADLIEGGFIKPVAP